jgi:Fe-S oxidoreductase
MATSDHPLDPHPLDPPYTDEAVVRDEVTRTFDVCGSCRRCTDLCGVFPTLFELLDRSSGPPDAGLLTPAQQDAIVAECFQCGRCVTDCPFRPGRHAVAIDVPHLMLRVQAMRRANDQLPASDRRLLRMLRHADAIGRIGSRFAKVINPWITATPGSLRRAALSAVTGVSPSRALLPFSAERFSSWFARRPSRPPDPSRCHVVIHPTCVVEYQSPRVARELVGILDRHDVDCSLSRARCCGAPLLDAGDLTHFAAVAAHNVEVLAGELGRGGELVVVQAACVRTLRDEYPTYAPGGEARLVAERTVDASEFLVGLAERPGDVQAGPAAATPSTVAYHAGRAHEPGERLVALTGAAVSTFRMGAGIDTVWGLRRTNDAVADRWQSSVGTAIARSPCDVAAGESLVANAAVAQHARRPVVHPIEVLTDGDVPAGPERGSDG